MKTVWIIAVFATLTAAAWATDRHPHVGGASERGDDDGENYSSSDAAAPEAAGEPKKITGWMYAGLGIGSGGVAANAGLNGKYGRYSVTGCATIAGGEDYYYDVALLFGYGVSEVITVAGGVGWVGVSVFRGSWWGGDREVTHTVGVPAEVQITPVKGREVGLGIVGHVNFNKDATFLVLPSG